MEELRQGANDTKNVTINRNVSPVLANVGRNIAKNRLAKKKDKSNHQRSAKNLKAKAKKLKKAGKRPIPWTGKHGLEHRRVRKKSASKYALTSRISRSETKEATVSTDSENGKSARVAVCFFGQVKHYEHVASSQQKHVFDILRTNNYSYDIFVHTYNQTEFKNPRNSLEKAKIVPASLQNILSLPSSSVLYDSPEDADKLYNIRDLAKNGDPWPDNPLLSILYFARQLHSLKRVTQLWTPAMHKYKFVLYLRPDALFLSPLDLSRNARALSPATLATPDWHRFGGLNDRLAYGVPAAMAAYGLRGDSLQRFVDSGQMPHAERFLKHCLASQGIAAVASRTKFQRVRANASTGETPPSPAGPGGRTDSARAGRLHGRSAPDPVWNRFPRGRRSPPRSPRLGGDDWGIRRVQRLDPHPRPGPGRRRLRQPRRRRQIRASAQRASPPRPRAPTAAARSPAGRARGLEAWAGARVGGREGEPRRDSIWPAASAGAAGRD